MYWIQSDSPFAFVRREIVRGERAAAIGGEDQQSLPSRGGVGRAGGIASVRPKARGHGVVHLDELGEDPVRLRVRVGAEDLLGV